MARWLGGLARQRVDQGLHRSNEPLVSADFLFGKGRAWSAINSTNFNNTYQSIVNIDANVSSPPIQNVTTPGRMVDFQDQPYATFAVGDASYAWNWTDTTAGTVYTPAEIAAGSFKMPIGNTYETHSKNSFAYTKLISDEMNAPLSGLNSWIDYNGLITPVTRAPNFPVLLEVECRLRKTAHRSARLVGHNDVNGDQAGAGTDRST